EQQLLLICCLLFHILGLKGPNALQYRRHSLFVAHINQAFNVRNVPGFCNITFVVFLFLVKMNAYYLYKPGKLHFSKEVRNHT
ncbi:hypothetical protein L9F63_018884, partial [Diploptera punctata]